MRIIKPEETQMSLKDDKSDGIYMGIDIGGTKCSVVIGDSSFRIIDKIGFETRVNRGWKEITGEFIESASVILSRNPGLKLRKTGISCGGPLDSRTGMIYSPPNLPGWDNVPVTNIFAEHFGVECSLQNDANACSLAEWMMGAGRGTRNMIFLTMGTGMGGGLILNGQLYCGTNDLGGEAGHIRLAGTGPSGYGKNGSFEGFCSGGGIAQLAKTIVAGKLKENIFVSFCPDIDHLEGLDAKIVCQAAASGDETAGEIIKISGEYLGSALAIMIDLLNPECIVIGSIYARNEDLFRPHVMRVVEKEALPGALEVCRIVPSELGDAIGDYAALCVALYNEKFNND